MTINEVTAKKDRASAGPGAGLPVPERMTPGQRFRLGVRKIVGAREATLAGVAGLPVAHLSLA